MVAVNYYEQEPVSKIESYETKIQVEPNQYQTDYLGAGTQSYNYQSYQPSVAAVTDPAPAQYIYTEPKYESLYSNPVV